MGILVSPCMQFVDVNGHPYAGARAYFYETATTTPVTLYDDVGLTTGHERPNPLVADSKGLFPVAYFSDSAEYRLIVKNSTDSVVLFDVDPVNKLLSITADEIATGAIETKLGYTPVNPAAAALTAPATMIFAVAPTSLSAYTMGYLGAPVNIKDASYNMVLSDAGKMLLHDDASPYNWTIPLNADVPFPVGTRINLANVNSGIITLQRGTDGVTTVELHLENSATNSDLSLGQWSCGHIRKTGTNQWIYVGTTGSGLVAKDADFTLAASDNGSRFLHSSGSAHAYTLPPNGTVALPIGFEFEALNIGAGTVTLTRGASVALRVAGASTDANVGVVQWRRAKVTKVGTDSWLLNYSV